MKNFVIKLAAVAAIIAPTFAIADTVTFSYVGQPQTDFTFNGLKCELIGSGSGSVPGGCNWDFGIAGNGEWSGRLVQGNGICTQSEAIKVSCKN